MAKQTWLTVAAVYAVVLVIALLRPSYASEQQFQEPTNNISLPVFAVEAEEGYPFLLEQMRGRKVVLLGDGSHGTTEFYSFRKRVTRDLITNHNLRVLVLEAEWDSAEMVDLYIRGLLSADVSPRTILQEAFHRWPQWVWANEEMVEFVLWLKDFNSEREPADMVRCFGMDMQMAVSVSLQYLLDNLADNSNLADRVKELIKWWEPYIADPDAMNQAYADGLETGNLHATEILLRLNSPDAKMRRVLNMLIAVENYYRTMSSDQHEAWNIRSRHFASFVVDLLQTPSGQHGVVAWAHNSHIGDMRGTETGGEVIESFGKLVRESLGEESVYLLGSTSFLGSVTASTEWGAQPSPVIVPPADPSSIEAFIYGGGWNNPLILFENDEQREAWSFSMPHRGIGVVYNPENEFPSNYLTSRIGQRYDAFIFWQKTSALQFLVSPP